MTLCYRGGCCCCWHSAPLLAIFAAAAKGMVCIHPPRRISSRASQPHEKSAPRSRLEWPRRAAWPHHEARCAGVYSPTHTLHTITWPLLLLPLTCSAADARALAPAAAVLCGAPCRRDPGPALSVAVGPRAGLKYLVHWIRTYGAERSVTVRVNASTQNGMSFSSEKSCMT